MNRRGWIYVAAVVLLGIVFSLPHILTALLLAREAYLQGGISSLYRIPGLTETVDIQNSLSFSPFWRDKIIGVSTNWGTADQSYSWFLQATDPETGGISDMGIRWPGGAYHEAIVFGDRLWIHARGGSSFEIVDDKAVPSTFSYFGPTPIDSQAFLLHGVPALVHESPSGFLVSVNDQGQWIGSGVVSLPDPERQWTIDEVPIRFPRLMQLYILNQGERIHLFLQFEGRLLHHEGLELAPISVSMRTWQSPFAVVDDRLIEPASALKPANTDAAIEGWSVINSDAINSSGSSTLRLLVNGQPAAMLVDESKPGFPIGHLFGFNGGRWELIATQAFPLGTRRFRNFVCQNGQKSYVAAMTSIGAAQIYAVDATGFRKTNGAGNQFNAVLVGELNNLYFPLIAMVLAIPYTGLVALCMWWWKDPRYESGHQAVRLASITVRGIARLIDLGLLIGSTFVLGMVLTRQFDWMELLEVLNLRLDHPALHAAIRVAAILCAWTLAIFTLTVAMQARFGLTPGKWCCGLRTVRTTLRPCGLARSLVREIVLCVDSCNLLCWTPGVLSIALTRCRQRLGDLVADTIVVEARSLKRS